jgi:general secretion pathway protein M
MNRLDLTPWQARWHQLSARERTALGLAGVVLALALVWQVALAPALRVWRDSSARHALLDRQQAELLALQSQARLLQARPVLSAQEARQTLTQLTRDLLPGAQLSDLADHQRVVLKGVSGASLAQWMSAVRQTAQARVMDMRLQRNPTSPETPALWDGQITLQLPLRGAP